jgi:photosystem II stability/assembly factor-like uncharacterized protein
MERDQTARPDDSLHPVRRLRRERSGRMGPPDGGSVPPEDAPSPAAFAGADPPLKRRFRLRLAGGLVLVLAVSGAWSAAALHGQPPAASTLPTGSTSGAPTTIPAQAPADAIGKLRMFSRSTGWAQRLIDGAVLHTTLGVLRWTVASPPTLETVIAVSYVDAVTARALTVPDGAEGQTTVDAWATGDGGTTWSLQGGFVMLGFSPALLGALDFVDPLHGWFSELQDDPGETGTALYRTVNGGALWSKVAVMGTTGPPGAGQIRPTPTGCVQLTAAFISRATGWLTGTCSAGPPPLYVTHDGGQTWADQPLTPIPGTLFGETSFPPSFTSAQDGTLVTQDVGATPLSAGLFATTNGGQTWALRYATAATPFGSDFVDAEHGWLAACSAGDAATPDLYFTGDGGAGWSMLYAFPSIGCVGVALDFLSGGTGWAATDSTETAGSVSYLLETNDGGHSWSALRPQLSPPSPPP